MLACLNECFPHPKVRTRFGSNRARIGLYEVYSPHTTCSPSPSPVSPPPSRPARKTQRVACIGQPRLAQFRSARRREGAGEGRGLVSSPGHACSRVCCTCVACCYFNRVDACPVCRMYDTGCTARQRSSSERCLGAPICIYADGFRFLVAMMAHRRGETMLHLSKGATGAKRAAHGASGVDTRRKKKENTWHRRLIYFGCRCHVRRTAPRKRCIST